MDKPPCSIIIDNDIYQRKQILNEKKIDVSTTKTQNTKTYYAPVENIYIKDKNLIEKYIKAKFFPIINTQKPLDQNVGTIIYNIERIYASDIEILKKTVGGIYYNNNSYITSYDMYRKLSRKGGDGRFLTDATSFENEFNKHLDDIVKFNEFFSSQTKYNVLYDNENFITKYTNDDISLLMQFNSVSLLPDKKRLYYLDNFISTIIIGNKDTLVKTNYSVQIPTYINYHGSYINNKAYTFTKFVEYYKYNAHINLGFELLLLEYIGYGHYDNYLEQQKKFILTLTTLELNIIRDYTRSNAYLFYIAPFKTNNTVPTPDTISKNPNIGNSFADIIYELITTKCINLPDTADFISNYLNNTLNNHGHCHNIYFQLQTIDWVFILSTFLEKLNSIIERAPEVEKPLILYTSSKYLNSTNDLLVSNQILSYTFNFEVIKSSYDKINDAITTMSSASSPKIDNTPIIYRVFVPKGVRLLFTSSLTDDEVLFNNLEFIASKNQIIKIDKQTQIGGTDDDIHDAYNNINMTNNIVLLQENKFKTQGFLLMVPPT